MNKFEQFKLAEKLHKIKIEIESFFDYNMWEEGEFENCPIMEYFTYFNSHIDVVSRINSDELSELIKNNVKIPKNIKLVIIEVSEDEDFELERNLDCFSLHIAILYKDETLQDEADSYGWTKQNDCGELLEPSDE